MALSVTSALGTGTNRTHVKQNFDDVVAWANGASLTNANLTGAAGITDANLASPNNSAYKSIREAQGHVPDGSTSGSYYFGISGVTKSAVGGATQSPVSIYFDDADYTVAGKTQKLRVRAQAYVGGTAPATTLTVGLYPISSVGGAGGLLVATLGTVVSGSTVAFASPAINSKNEGNSGDLTIPADGHYVLGVALAGTTAVNATVGLSVQLQTRSV